MSLQRAGRHAMLAPMHRRHTLAWLAIAFTAPGARAARREFALEAFSALEVSGSVSVELVQRQPAQAWADGSDAALSRLSLRVESGVLRLRNLPSQLRMVLQVWALERIEVSGSAVVSADELVAKRLALSVGGSAQVRFDRLTTEALAVKAGGSGGVRVAGRANEIDAAMGGSAGLEAREFRVRRAAVKLGGSSFASLWADDRLDGAIGGSSNLRYRGTPRVQVARGGSAGVWPES